MHRCIVVMLLVMSLIARAENQKYIEWLSSLNQQGIPVSSMDWFILASNPSNAKLTEIVHRYAEYVDMGRVRRSMFQPTWQIAEEQSRISLQQLSIPLLQSLESKIPEYQTLKQTLARLSEWQKTAERFFPDDLIFFEGDQHASVLQLNRWLLDLDLVDSLRGDQFTQQHKDVLTKVQLDFDLGPDGRLGVNTRQALLAITNDRIRVLKTNLERLRWLPRELPYPHIRVDIAGNNVAWVENARKQTLHRAIVGTPHKQTPIFSHEVESITVNPVWKVPHSIAARSMLRAEKKNPGLLKKEGFVVYESWDDNAAEVPIDRIQWQSLTTRNFRYRLEQQPGELNRLGRYKLDLPNNYGVYLHDTDQPELFEKTKRFFSSGCTRVEHIDQLIDRLLMTQTDITEEHEPGKITYKKVLAKPIPVYFVYFTAWPDETGRVRFRDDVYQMDRAMVSWF